MRRILDDCEVDSSEISRLISEAQTLIITPYHAVVTSLSNPTEIYQNHLLEMLKCIRNSPLESHKESGSRIRCQ